MVPFSRLFPRNHACSHWARGAIFAASFEVAAECVNCIMKIESSSRVAPPVGSGKPSLNLQRLRNSPPRSILFLFILFKLRLGWMIARLRQTDPLGLQDARSLCSITKTVFWFCAILLDLERLNAQCKGSRCFEKRRALGIPRVFILLFFPESHFRLIVQLESFEFHYSPHGLLTLIFGQGVGAWWASPF